MNSGVGERLANWFDFLLILYCRETLEAYSVEMKKLAMTILSQMTKALKMKAEEIRDMFSDGVQSMRMNYYPPCPEPDMTIGFSPHSDADALTILFQLNDTEGLQIRKEGRWVPVKPLPNAFVVNIGDIMEVLFFTIVHYIAWKPFVYDRVTWNICMWLSLGRSIQLHHTVKLHLAMINTGGTEYPGWNELD